MLITEANIIDMNDIEQIGKKSLPIYYNETYLCDMSLIHNFSILKLSILDKTNLIIIGFIVYKTYNEKIHIMSFAIDPEFRECGYGSSIMNHMKTLNKNISLYVKEDNDIAINFYIKNGFIKDKLIENYYNNFDNNNAIYMLYTHNK